MKVLAVLALTGCAQVLGLDDTKLDKIDAAIDAPGVCDGTPQCTSLNGRSVCGQLYQTGDMAGVPLRAANPTGTACQPADMTGPCAFRVVGLTRASFLSGGTTGTDAVIDDCGRYAVIDFDSTQPDVAVLLTGDDTMYKRTASLLLGRTTLGGPNNTDKGVDLHVVTKATATSWAMQLSPTTPPDTSTGYLVRYLRQGQPLAKVKVAKDNSSGFSTMPGQVPWAAYFTGATAFGSVDAAQNETVSLGTAFAVFGGGTFSLQGVISGSRCQLDGLNQIDNTLIYVNVPGC